MASSRALATLLTAALSLAAATAWADPTPQQRDLARNLMQKGRDARAAHDNKLALESFKAADDIMRVPTTGFEVARSLADLGRLVDAHEMLLRVMQIPERPDDSQGFRDARGYAKVLDDDLVQRIPRLRITVDGAPMDKVTSITVDGVALPAAAVLVPYKVDPGHHVIVARTDGAEGRAEIDEVERDTKAVVVHVVETPVGATPASAPAAPDAPPAAPDTTTEPRGLGTATWIGLGVAAAGLVAGSVTGALSIADKGSLASQCNGTRCPPSANGTLRNANAFATVSDVSFIVAGVGAGLGLAGFLWLRPSAAPATSASVRAWIGPGSAGVSGTF